MADRFLIDSAGTGGWHAGHPPDPRSVAVARQHGIDISNQKARQVRAVDFVNFDVILAMDEDNFDRLRASCPMQYKHNIHLFTQYATGRRENVPDPYYGGEDGFQTVYTMLLDGCISALEKLETGQDS